MAKNLMLSLLLLLLLPSRWVWAQPQMTFDVLEIDKGLFPQGMSCDFKFEFTNTGDSTLVLHQVKSSCGCLVPRWGMEPIPPGGRGVVEGHYDSNRLGIFQKSLTVMSNDPRNPVLTLRLKGEVFATPRLDYFTQTGGEFLSFLPAESEGTRCPGGKDNRPCIPAPDSPRLILVKNPNDWTAASVDLCTYNDAPAGHFGIFFCPADSALTRQIETPGAVSPFNPAYVAQHWGTRFTDSYHLSPNGCVFMVILDIAWLRERVFVDPIAEWAVPVGVAKL